MNKFVSSDIKRFFKSIIIVISGVIIVDVAIGSGLKCLYKNQSSGLLYRANYAIETTTADILVLGSSRANHHYDPKVFEENLNATFYNGGRDAQGAVYSCAVASSVIQRYRPKCIIIDIRPNEFTTSDEDNIATILPYKDDKAIRSFFSYKGPFEEIKLFSQIYPYNSMLTNLLLGIMPFNKTRTKDYKGYLALQGIKDTAQLAESRETNPIDTAKVRYFNSLLKELDKKRIPALVVISPVRGDLVEGATVKLSKSMCDKFKSIKFLNFAHHQISKDARYFNDGFHLNDAGAVTFSRELVRSLREVMNN